MDGISAALAAVELAKLAKEGVDAIMTATDLSGELRSSADKLRERLDGIENNLERLQGHPAEVGAVRAVLDDTLAFVQSAPHMKKIRRERIAQIELNLLQLKEQPTANVADVEARLDDVIAFVQSAPGVKQPVRESLDDIKKGLLQLKGQQANVVAVKAVLDAVIAFVQSTPGVKQPVHKVSGYARKMKWRLSANGKMKELNERLDRVNNDLGNQISTFLAVESAERAKLDAVRSEREARGPVASCALPSKYGVKAALSKLVGFEPMRRAWVLDKIKDWYTTASDPWTRAFVLLGDAGMGKSVLAAQLASDGPQVLECEGFTVGAAHFFNYGAQDSSDTRQVIFSIAEQLCSTVPGLREELAKVDADALANINDMSQLFRRVVAEPCRAVAPPPAGRVVVIFDALDECEKTARAQLLDILQADFLRECPKWLGFLATSRKQDYIPLKLECFHPTLLDADEHNNVEDLRFYFNRKLVDAGLSGTELARATEVLADRSEGLFLYARFADDALRQLKLDKKVTLAAIEDEANFATGMPAVYAQYFGRFKKTALGGSDDLYETVIGALLVARDPLPLGLLEEKLSSLPQQLRRKFAELARNLLIVGDDGTLRFVHKSMADWVCWDVNPGSDELGVQRKQGHENLAELCFKQRTHPFALRHMLHHLCDAERVPDAAALLLDVSWLLKALQDDGVDPVDLVLDADPFLDKPGEPAGDVLRVLEKGANALRHDPREIASQLYGRLQKPHHALDSVDSSFTGRWLKPVKPSLEPAQSALRKTLVGHRSFVSSVVHSHKLDMIVSGSWDDTVKVWKASTGQLLRTLEGHSSRVTSVAVSAELDMVVSGSSDKTVKLWKASVGQLLRTLEGDAVSVQSVAVSAELDMIVSGSEDKTVKLWKASAGQLLRTLEGHAGSVQSVAVSAELDMIVSGSEDKTVKMWKASTGQLLRTLEGHSHSVQSVAVSADLGMIVSGSDDKTVKVWKASTSQFLRTLEGHSGAVNGVAVSAELDVIVSGSGQMFGSDNTVKVWKASTGQLLRTLEGHSGWVQSVAVSATLDMIVSGSRDETAKVWKASTGQLQRTLEGHSSSVYKVVVSAELDMIVSGSRDETAKVWKASTGQLLHTLEGHSASVWSVAVSTKLDMIVSGSQDNTVKVWKASTGQLLRTLEGHSGGVDSVAVSAELDMIVSGSRDMTAKVWKASTGQLLRTLEGHSRRVFSVAVSADMITSRAYGKTLFWDVRTFEQIQLRGRRETRRESPRSDDAVYVQGGYHVSIPGIDCVGFSTDVATMANRVVARAGDIVAVVDATHTVHVLCVTSSGQASSSA